MVKSMASRSVRTDCDRGNANVRKSRLSKRLLKKLLSRAPLYFGVRVKSLVPAAFAVVRIHQSQRARLVG
jgi:hypothetical protein